MPDKKQESSNSPNHAVGSRRMTTSRLGAALLVIIVVIFGLYLWAVAAGFGPFSDRTDGGLFGDAFGALTSFFNALAFAGLLIAVLLQREDLQIQRQELHETRAVLREQKQQLANQADAAQKQVFESTFFRLLEATRQLVNNCQSPSSARGITAMYEWALALRDYSGGALKRPDLDQNPLEAGKIFRSWYPGLRSQLDPYFELLTMTMEFIHRSDRTDKIFYMDMLRATLSPGEQFLLFHYGVAIEGGSRFKELAEEYGFLENFAPETFDLPGARRMWYTARRVQRNYAKPIR